MIPRYQTVLFGLLLVTSLVMAVVLWQLREHAHQRMLAGQDSAPTQAPHVTPAEQAVLVVANDADGSLMTQMHALPLPQDTGSRLRTILGKLLDLYAAEGATHPVPGGAASVSQVFLMSLPESAQKAAATDVAGTQSNKVVVSLNNAPSPAADFSAKDAAAKDQPLLAVVNLTAGFANNHPAGLEAETLTLLSLCGTLHANQPRIAQVRFLVDGQVRDTLAGHADLSRTYLTAESQSAGQ